MPRVLSYFGFLLVLVLFALPFGAVRQDVSSDGIVWARYAETWHGTDLVFGGHPRFHGEEWAGDHYVVSDDLADTSSRLAKLPDPFDLTPQPAFVAAVVLLLGGAAAEMVVRSRVRAVVSAAIAVTTLGVLLLGQWLVAWHYTHRLPLNLGQTLLPAYGLWIALGVLVALGTANVIDAVVRRPAPTSVPDPGPAERSASG